MDYGAGMGLLAWIATSVVVVVSGVVVLARWGMQWGATAEERAARMPGDEFLVDPRPARVVMTRAVSIDAPPATVWPWLAQLGRGAGWYSFDRLDNGGRESARHVVSWVPPLALGDASPVGYLRRVDPGSGFTWWSYGVRFLGASQRGSYDVHLRADGSTSRLVIRWTSDATGVLARPALWAFCVIDSIMSIRQLKGIRQRAERHDARTSDPERPETGARSQFQHYEIIYASGERAGIPGKERAEHWHRKAIEDGVIAALE